MDHSMKSLIALWVMWAVALLAAKFLTPEIWRWYKWYALVVGVICTLILAPAAFYDDGVESVYLLNGTEITIAAIEHLL